MLMLSEGPSLLIVPIASRSSRDTLMKPGSGAGVGGPAMLRSESCASAWAICNSGAQALVLVASASRRLTIILVVWLVRCKAGSKGLP